MLQACLNGGRTSEQSPGVPITPKQLAEEAYQAVKEGADELHIHPRNSDGIESLAPDDVAACVRAIKQILPQTPIGVGTGAWINPKGRKRLALIRDWIELPDYASVNLEEDDAYENMEILCAKGIGIEAGIANAKEAENFIASKFSGKALRILIEIPPCAPHLARAEYQAVMNVLINSPIKRPILLHGFDESAWAMAKLAFQNGHDTRVGLEDMLELPNGKRAQSNSEIVRAAKALQSR